MSEDLYDRAAETASLGELDGTRMSGLKEAVSLAYNHTQYYHRLFEGLGVNEQSLQTPEDFMRIPFTSARNLVDDPVAFRNDAAKVYRLACSSGSTGKPKILYRTYDDFVQSSEIAARMFYTTGVRDYDVVAILQPFGMWNIGAIGLEGFRLVGCESLPIGTHMDDISALELIRDTLTSVIYSTPSHLLRLTKKGVETGRIRKPSKVKKILLAGEGYTPEQSSYLKTAWDADVFSIYGSEETDGLGAECETHGGIHLNYDVFQTELLDPDTGKTSNDKGELIVTPLRLKGTILLRYRLGDIVAIDWSKCNCGRTLPRVKMIGKSDDCITITGGIKLYPYQIESALSNSRILDYQVLKKTKSDATELTFLVESDAPVDEQGLTQNLTRLSLDFNDAISSGFVTLSVKRVKPEEFVYLARGKKPTFVNA